MWDGIQYRLLYGWVRLHALLPMRLLYGLADLLYVLIYKVIRYRVKVVRENLKAAFPEMDEDGRHRIERAFYHHFADYIVETVKLAHIPLDELQKRAYVKNPEMVDRLMEKGHTCLVMLMGHYGNWEWFCGSGSRMENARIYQIYRPLKNKAFDRLFIRLRTRFGSCGIRKQDTVRDLIRLKKERTRCIVIFIADQTPSPNNQHYWTTFLNQETSILNGPERLARKLDLPVLYLDVRQVKRGYYTLELKLLTETPKTVPENRITEQYARLMEQSILRNPAGWLWTHKRWKYKRTAS